MLKLSRVHHWVLSVLASLIFFLIALLILAISLISENQKAAGINEITGQPINYDLRD